MELPLQIVFRDIPKSEAVEAAIRKHAAKLDEFDSRVMSCRVALEHDANHQHQGKLYSVHIDLKVPGKEISSSHGHANQDVYAAIRDAFDAVQRQLEDHVRAQRGQAKLRHP
jgi:ribosomal subunit interface protein